MKKYLPKIFLTLFVLVTIFIFSNSLQDANTSGELSGRLLDTIKSVLTLLNIQNADSLSQYILRKLAHFSEFAAQSCFLSSYFISKNKKFKEFLIYVLFTGLFSGCFDEFLQLFPVGRAGMIQDVFIDFSGTIAGILFTTLIYLSIKQIKNQNRMSLNKHNETR